MANWRLLPPLFWSLALPPPHRLASRQSADSGLGYNCCLFHRRLKLFCRNGNFLRLNQHYLSSRGCTLNSKHLYRLSQHPRVLGFSRKLKKVPLIDLLDQQLKDPRFQSCSEQPCLLTSRTFFLRSGEGIDLRELSVYSFPFDQWERGSGWFNREYPDRWRNRAKLYVRHACAAANFRNQARDHVRSTPEGRHRSLPVGKVNLVQARPRQRIPEIAARKSVAMPRDHFQFECLSGSLLNGASRSPIFVPRSSKSSRTTNFHSFNTVRVTWDVYDSKPTCTVNYLEFSL